MLDAVFEPEHLLSTFGLRPLNLLFHLATFGLHFFDLLFRLATLGLESLIALYSQLIYLSFEMADSRVEGFDSAVLLGDFALC